jgi:ATP-dependent Clp protease adaptor protein ClpS
MSNELGHESSPVAVEKKAKEQHKRPSKYQILLLNDDYTPMDFVIEVLQKFFFMEYNQAVNVMLDVHRKGKGTCGVYTRDIAETKVAQVISFAEQHECPLLCKMEVLNTN